MDQSTFWSEEHLASLSASPDCEADWQMTVATWPSNFFALLNEHGPGGWFGRTSPASCHRTADGTLEPSSGGWRNSGTGSPTQFVTLNSSEFPSDAAVCSLSDILETGDVMDMRPDSLKTRELVAKGKALFDRCKVNPEHDKGAFMALIELRNMWPDLEMVLTAYADDADEWVDLPRMTMGKQD